VHPRRWVVERLIGWRAEIAILIGGLPYQLGEPEMRVFLSIVAMTILLAPVAASAHGKDGKGECHQHKDEKTYHCHP
jgi:hypothetical protein